MGNSKIENKESKVFNLINWKSIAIGIIITLIGYSIYNGSYAYYTLYDYPEYLYVDSGILFVVLMLLTVIAGFTVAFLNKPQYKAGIINVVFATIAGIYLSNLLIGLLIVLNGPPIPMSYLIYIIFTPIEMTILFSIPIGLVGIFGAFIGTSIKKLKIRN